MNSEQLYMLFTDPICVKIAWELPVPYWIICLIMLYDIMQGRVKDISDFLWLFGQLFFVSTAKFLLIVVALPFLAGKFENKMRWLGTYVLRLGLIFMDVGDQVTRVSPECLAKIASANYEK